MVGKACNCTVSDVQRFAQLDNGSNCCYLFLIPFSRNFDFWMFHIIHFSHKTLTSVILIKFKLFLHAIHTQRNRRFSTNTRYLLRCRAPFVIVWKSCFNVPYHIFILLSPRSDSFHRRPSGPAIYDSYKINFFPNVWLLKVYINIYKYQKHQPCILFGDSINIPIEIQ